MSVARGAPLNSLQHTNETNNHKQPILEEDEGEGDTPDGHTGMESCDKASSVPGFRYCSAAAGCVLQHQLRSGDL
ncbi:hypothetical protein QQF64_005219 [Cirrhinus molitorella]|uniref:Uncharacterized protein n=1 Tax=Cirrhinus molitorella TaxID=172907 RepID=A0ABR3MKJ6_9TELE